MVLSTSIAVNAMLCASGLYEDERYEEEEDVEKGEEGEDEEYASGEKKVVVKERGSLCEESRRMPTTTLRFIFTKPVSQALDCRAAQ
jgi:hypothetical protein